MKAPIIFFLITLPLLTSPVKAAEGYWLDQYNALLYLGIWRLDDELKELKGKGAKVLMFHADSLPSPFSMVYCLESKRSWRYGVSRMDSETQQRQP